MAEIHLEPKSRSIWPWVLGLVALVAVIAIWATAADRDPAEESAAARPAAEAPVGTAGAPGGAVGEYLAFAGASAGANAQAQMGKDHEYTAEGIRKLRDALKVVVDRSNDQDAGARFERFREVADRIEKDPASGAHAGAVRDAFTQAADVLGSVDSAPNVQGLRSTAESIETSQPLLDQREKVHSFFRQSADAIQAAVRQ